MKTKVTYNLWEDNEYAIIIDNIGVVGQTLNEKDAKVIANWLESAIDEIIQKQQTTE